GLAGVSVRRRLTSEGRNELQQLVAQRRARIHGTPTLSMRASLARPPLRGMLEKCRPPGHPSAILFGRRMTSRMRGHLSFYTLALALGFSVLAAGGIHMPVLATFAALVVASAFLSLFLSEL